MKDVGQLIQGKVAGLAITNPNGDPTGSTQIRLVVQIPLVEPIQPPWC